MPNTRYAAKIMQTHRGLPDGCRNNYALLSRTSRISRRGSTIHPAVSFYNMLLLQANFYHAQSSWPSGSAGGGCSGRNYAIGSSAYRLLRPAADLVCGLAPSSVITLHKYTRPTFSPTPSSSSSSSCFIAFVTYSLPGCFCIALHTQSALYLLIKQASSWGHSFWPRSPCLLQASWLTHSQRSPWPNKTSQTSMDN